MKFTTTLLLAAAAHLASADNWTKGGCYKSAGSLTDNGPDTYQSLGLCSGVGSGKNAKVIAMTGGDTCYYGNSLPSSDDKVDDSKCDKSCQGYPDNNCGGNGFYRVYTNGVVDSSGSGSSNSNSDSDSGSDSKSSSASPTATAVTVVTSAGAEKTVIVTQANPSQAAATVQVTQTHSAAPDTSNNGPNKGAIAAGVVVGVVGVAAIAGAIFLFMRSRKQKEEAAELQRQNSIAGLRSEKPPSTYSMPDSRLEPAYMRRMSDGSIADNQDYSRRILKVTNPDDR